METIHLPSPPGDSGASFSLRITGLEMGQVGIDCLDSLPSFLNMNLLDLLPPTPSNIPPTVACEGLASPPPPQAWNIGFWNIVTPLIALEPQVPNLPGREVQIYKE